MTTDDATRVRRRNDVSSRTSGEEMLLLDEATGSVHVINRTAARVWELCADEPSVEQLVDGIAETYGMTPADVHDDVHELVRTFSELGVVELLPPR